ncbi:MAG: gliding motility-associated C-terminal domain-containing protein [Vicingaceae bacterium]
MKKVKLINIFFFLLIFSSSVGQTVFNMSNTTTTDCQGTLLDSEGGSTSATYGNNEDFTFVICSGGKITMTFNSPFCVDSGFDFLRFFDGPDTNSTLLGTYTGYTVPPTITANSGCLTAHFKSDANATYCGWDADWTTDKVPPIPPTMTVNPVPACSSTTITLVLSKNILCDSVDPGDFTITGPVPNIWVNTITSSLNCSSPGDSSATFTLHLNKALSQDCYYDVIADVGLPDNCDSIWHFILVDSFLIDDCPFNVNITAVPDTICPGMCSDLTAVISGNGPNCLTYNYTWNQSLPNSPGPHTVCPNSPTNFNINYNVSVQATTGGPTALASKTLVFVNPEINEADTITKCQSDTAFILKAFNSGGRFSGPGVVNAVTGLFSPDLAGGGNHYIKYGYPNYCEDSILIIINAIDAGLPEAACPGDAPFLVKGFSPTGGTWSGDSITASGIFNPALSGSYTVTYSVNGCTESKVITVDSIVLNTPIDTLCKSDTAFQISITPPGGRWTGSGITDSVLGIFNPALANIGQNNLTYKLSGSGNTCSFNLTANVLQIEAGWNLVACPYQPSFTLTGGQPGGGWWTGIGITDSAAGTYDPSWMTGNWGNDTVIYHHPNGCTDWRVIYVRYTYIVYDSLEFCVNDPSIYLDWVNVRRTPGGGTWTGNGLTNIGSRYYFNPSIAGVGVHKLMYTANTCKDSIYMVVYPSFIRNIPFSNPYPDTTVCNTHPNWNFPSMPPGGNWTGKGIIDSKLGTFSPSAAGSGTHIIKYETAGNCINDSVIVKVYNFVPAQIIGLDSIYCYKDTSIDFLLKPLKGKFTGIGIDSNMNFNPALAGQGVHTLTYSYGTGLCATSTSMEIEVLPELVADLTASDTLICPGEISHLEVFANGGKPGSTLTYRWNNGLFPISEHDVSPSTSTWYSVITEDGCSAPNIDSVFIAVDQPIVVSFNTSDTLCFGEDGYVVANINDPNSPYEVKWLTDPDIVADSINGKAGDNYRVIITKLNSGCKKDTTVKIPSFKNVTALFSVSPNFECIPSDQKLVTMLDLSFNAVSGFWDIDGSRTIPYELGENPNHTFNQAGYYTITLTVFNKGGCSDEYSKEICVEDITPVFVADAFTPNGDGVNDVLHVKAQGIKELRFIVFDRWGNVVFETENIEEGWDGTIGGKKANPGVYVYIVESKLINNQKVVEKGDVTLIR